jgi:hypothetical protein
MRCAAHYRCPAFARVPKVDLQNLARDLLEAL